MKVSTIDAVIQQLLGTDSIRRIECEGDWHLEPAPELAAVPAGELLTVNTLSPGTLTIVFAILKTARVAASAESPTAKPGAKIAPVRKIVKRAGAQIIPLKLNATAHKLLKQHKQLVVKLRLKFTAKGRKTVTKTQTVTITPTPAKPRTCQAKKPKLPTNTLPSCFKR